MVWSADPSGHISQQLPNCFPHWTLCGQSSAEQPESLLPGKMGHATPLLKILQCAHSTQRRSQSPSAT